MRPKKNPSASRSKSSPSRAASTRHIRTTTTPSPDTPIVAKKGRPARATTKPVEGNTVAGTRTAARRAKHGNPETETEVALTDVLEEVIDIVDSPIAAAASTLAYKLAYGDSDDCSETATDRHNNETNLESIRYIPLTELTLTVTCLQLPLACYLEMKIRRIGRHSGLL